MKNTVLTIDTVYAQLRTTVKVYGSHPFLHIPRQATRAYQNAAIDFSYDEMCAAVEQARECYLQAGYGAGHRVALALENRLEFFVHFFALNGLGVCVVPVNADFVCDEIAYLIDDSDVSVVITLPDHEHRINEAKASIARVVEVLCIDNLENLPAPPAVDLSTIKTGLKAEATILYTSGTTGKPKGCVLANEFFFVSDIGT